MFDYNVTLETLETLVKNPHLYNEFVDGYKIYWGISNVSEPAGEGLDKKKNLLNKIIGRTSNSVANVHTLRKMVELYANNHNFHEAEMNIRFYEDDTVVVGAMFRLLNAIGKNGINSRWLPAIRTVRKYCDITIFENVWHKYMGAPNINVFWGISPQDLPSFLNTINPSVHTKDLITRYVTKMHSPDRPWWTPLGIDIIYEKSRKNVLPTFEVFTKDGEDND